MPNLLKYALGLNPLVPATNPVVADIGTGSLRLTAPKNKEATDAIIHAEITDNLAKPWTTNGIAVDQDTPSLLQVHENAPVTNSPGAFMRLHVMRR